MPDQKRPLKVFLCHASTDKPKVRELYRYLKKRGIQPWFDEEDLVGGQDWQVEIPKALATSDAIIICLTKNSVDKEGYIQKEIKFALDKALEMPEGRIFLIPVKFEECEVPFSLSRYQWVDLTVELGYAKMMKALKFRASQLERSTVDVSKKDIEEENFAREKKERETAERERKENESREKQAHEAREKEKRETEKKEEKSVAVKPKVGSQLAYWLGGFIVLALGIIFLSSLNNQQSPFEPKLTNTPAIVSITQTTKTPEIILSPTVAVTSTPTKDLIDSLDDLAYFEIDNNKQCSLVLGKSKVPCPDPSPSLDRSFSWSPNKKYAVILNSGAYEEQIFQGLDWTYYNLSIYIQPTNMGDPKLFKYFSKNYTFAGLDWIDENRILYKFKENGLMKVVEYDFESQDEMTIAKTASFLGNYELSPDETKFVYTISFTSDKGDVVVRDIASGSEKSLDDLISVDMLFHQHVDWIDDDHVLINTYQSNERNIYIYSLSKDEISLIGQGDLIGVSPNKKWVAFYSNGLQIYDVDNGTSKEYGDVHLGEVFWGLWSPDSQLLSLIKDGGTYLFEVDKQVLRSEVNEFKALRNVMWTSDSKKLVVVDSVTNSSALYSIDVRDETKVTLIAEQFQTIDNLELSDDNTKIAFIVKNESGTSLYVAKMDGSQMLKIESNGNLYAPAWMTTE